MSDALRASYDAWPYDSTPFRESDIDHLASITRFHGLSPAPADRCRVLELGCAAGGNILPMADRFPRSTFVGVDLSPVQIDAGQRVIDGAALTNVALHARSIVDLGPGDGEFDYIICHGVYSWVPREVQAAVLRVCRECLAPNGVAYVSYNTYPGWHMRMMLRDVMMVNDDRSLTPARRVARARSHVERLGTSVAKASGPYASIFQREIELLRTVPDSVVFHQQLEEFNEPVLLSEFVRRANANGLAYLADARIENSNWAKPDEPAHRTRGEVVRSEQERDFLVERTFHRSVLCRDSAPIDLRKRTEVARDSFVVLRGNEVAPNADADENAPGVRMFRTPEGARLGTASPVLLGVFDELIAAAPTALHFNDLVNGIRRRHGLAGAPLAEDDVTALPTTLLTVAQIGMMMFVSSPSDVTAQVSARPMASALTRWQAAQRLAVTNRLHVHQTLPPLAVFLLAYLDGTRDRDQLVGEVQRALDDGRMSTPTRPDTAQITAIVDESLRRFASSALLLA